LTRKLAQKHERPYLHLDLNKLSASEAIVQLRDWIQKNNIQIMNVAGSRASKDDQIYNAVKMILTRNRGQNYFSIEKNQQ